jgi:hypothetical protein
VAVYVDVGVAVEVPVGTAVGVWVNVGGTHCVGEGLSVTPGSRVAVATDGVLVLVIVGEGIGVPFDRMLGANASAPRPRQ